MGTWQEVGAGVFQRRYDPLDVSVCVVRGSAGLLLVDTRSSHHEADEILEDVRAFGAPVRWVVNTHAHFDHSFGNFRLGPASEVGAPIYGHERVPAHLARYETPMLAGWVHRGDGPVPHLDEVVITPPTVLVGDRTRLDLGGRDVELVHLGRGHTDNDLLVHVADASTWLVGDLVEESGPPMYGSGSFPLDWPDTLGALLDQIEDGAALVPGHGAPVGSAFVAAQREQLQLVADWIRVLHADGVAQEDAVAAGSGRWPFADDVVGPAVRDGYAQLAV